MNLRFKEGQMVKMTGHDDMIVEGAIGIITDVQTETVKVLWGGMSAFKVDYKYRYGLKEITTTEVDPKNIEVADKLSSWPKEPTKEELNAALLELALDKGWYDDNEEHDIHPVQIPKNQMGIAVKELKAKYPAADGKKIADLVKANLCN